MADSMLRAWWLRLQGRLPPTPCPCSQAWILDIPFRAWRAGPRKILGRFGLAPGTRVLEIGPGTGYYSREAARMLRPSGFLICLDIQQAMLRRVKDRLGAAGAASIGVVQADASRLPFRSGSLDHVFLITVLGELPDRRQALSEVRRVLRPAGKLSISEQFPDPDFVTLPALRRELPSLGFVELGSRGRLVYTSTWALPVP